MVVSGKAARLLDYGAPRVGYVTNLELFRLGIK